MGDDDITWVDACPNCDATKNRERKTKTPRYKCGVCGATFAEPKTRRSKHHAHISLDDPEAPTERYERVREALKHAVDDGVRYARSKRLAEYCDLTPHMIGGLLGEYGIEAGDVSKRSDASTGVLWRIDVERVGVAVNSGQIYHTNEDCPAIKGDLNWSWTREKAESWGKRECQHCRGEVGGETPDFSLNDDLDEAEVERGFADD